MATRRDFLRSSAAGVAATLAPRCAWAEAGAPAFLACARDAAGAFWLAGLRRDGTPAFRVPLPARGHAGAAHPRRAEAVVFARRPGTFALVLDVGAGAVTTTLAPPPGRQFNGHGAYLGQGAILCTSEVIAEGSAGRIGLWDAGDGYRRIGEWDTGGIGPHEILALGPDRLVVANGGIVTDPTDRTKLNLETMEPSLTLLSADGVRLEQAALPADLHQASIRHLAVTSAGRIAFATQWEGDPALAVPTLGLWSPGEAPQLATAPEVELSAAAGYGGSVATAAGLVAVTSPKGGCVQIFDGDGRWRATHRRADICGIAATAEGFVASDGLGRLWTLGLDGLAPLEAPGAALSWDNHIVALGS